MVLGSWGVSACSLLQLLPAASLSPPLPPGLILPALPCPCSPCPPAPTSPGCWESTTALLGWGLPSLCSLWPRALVPAGGVARCPRACLLGSCQAALLFPLLFLSDVMESIAGACSARCRWQPVPCAWLEATVELGGLPGAGPALCGHGLAPAPALLCLLLLPAGAGAAVAQPLPLRALSACRAEPRLGTASPCMLGRCCLWSRQPRRFCPRAGLSLLLQVPSSSQGDRSAPALRGASTSDPQPWPGSAPQLLAVQWSMQLPRFCSLCQVHLTLPPCLLLLLPETPVLPAGARPGSCWQLAVPTLSSHTCWPNCRARALGSGRALPPASWALSQAASRAWTQWAAARACSRDPPVPLCLWRAEPCSCHGNALGTWMVPYLGVGPIQRTARTFKCSQEQQPGRRRHSGHQAWPGWRLQPRTGAVAGLCWWHPG